MTSDYYSSSSGSALGGPGAEPALGYPAAEPMSGYPANAEMEPGYLIELEPPPDF